MDKPSTTLVIKSPTFLNSFNPKPLVVAACVPSLMPEVIVIFCVSKGIPFLLQVMFAFPKLVSAALPVTLKGLKSTNIKCVSVPPENILKPLLFKVSDKILSETLNNNGFKIFSGGTDTHLMLVDLRPFNVTGKAAETSLGKANITCNKNGIPFDTQKMTITSGIRLGTQAATTRGFGLNEFKKVGDLITRVVEGLSKNTEGNSKIETEVKKEVVALCSKFPIYNHLIKK